MNKKPISYLQTDKRWKDKGWNGMTIGPSGCGPTAAAMLISTLTGKEVTPEETFSWAGTHGHLEKGHGTNYTTYFQKQFAEYGLRAEMLNWQNTYGKPDHANHAKMLELLKAGYYIIALMGPGLWTTGGHFVVVWWEDEKIRINDPASTKTARLNGDPKTFFGQAKYYWWVDARAFNKAPAVTPAEPEGQVKRIYTVKRGDTLGAIARAANSTVSILAELNAIDNPNLIHVGQVIMLEKTAGAAAEKLATLGVIAAMTYWSRTAETVPWLKELLLGAARKVAKAGTRTATAEEGMSALVAAGVVNTPDYWRELLKQKKVTNLDDLMCALGGALK